MQRGGSKLLHTKESSSDKPLRPPILLKTKYSLKALHSS